MTPDNHSCSSYNIFYFKCKLPGNSLSMGGPRENNIPHRTKEHNKALGLKYHTPLSYLHCYSVQWENLAIVHTVETYRIILCRCVHTYRLIWRTKSFKSNWTKYLLGLIHLLSVLYLECILCVVQTIDPDVIVQSCAGDGSKNSQFEPLSGCLADWLAHQAVGPQCLC